MIPATASAPAIPRRTTRRVPFVALSGLMALIALVGFWPTYYGPLAAGTLAHPLLIHIHAVVFTGWLVLFFLQAFFAATRRITWHLALGQMGIWYGLLLIGVGLTTGVLRSADPQAGDPLRLLYVAIADMVMFAGFFGAAIVYRRKPQLHKRMMVVAATSLLVAAVGRMEFLPPPPSGIPFRLLIWSAPVLLATVVDFRKSRTIHPVYLAGLATFLLRAVSVPVATTDAWRSFAQWVFGFVR